MAEKSETITLYDPDGLVYRTGDRAEADHMIRTAGYSETKPKAKDEPENKAKPEPKNK